MSSYFGKVDPVYAAVGDAFARNFRERGEVGAACCVYVGGRPVVDVWGGIADVGSDRPWAADTIALTFSATKGATAICINGLVERGQLDLDAPIADLWPEFAAQGKGAITTRMVLSHRAGLAAVDGELSLEEVLAGGPVVNAIAAQAPQWTPGTAHGYHARSYGWILGEILRRITGRSLGRYFAEEVAAPLGLEFWIGLPTEYLPRCARLIFPPPATILPLVTPLTVRVSTGPSHLFGYNDMWNRPELLRAEMPSSTGVGTARALARMYAASIGTVDGDAPAVRGNGLRGVDCALAGTRSVDPHRDLLRSRVHVAADAGHRLRTREFRAPGGRRCDRFRGPGGVARVRLRDQRPAL